MPRKITDETRVLSALDSLHAMSKAEFREFMFEVRRRHAVGIMRDGSRRVLYWQSAGGMAREAVRVPAVHKSVHAKASGAGPRRGKPKTYHRAALENSQAILRSAQSVLHDMWEVRDPDENHRVMYYRTGAALAREMADGQGEMYGL